MTFGEVLHKKLKNKNRNGCDNFGTYNSHVLCERCKKITTDVRQGVDKVEIF